MFNILTDKNGNTASIAYFGNKEKAQAALNSLINCSNCHNCSNCSNCHNCSDCSNCNYCYECHNCNYCNYCYECHNCNYCNYIKKCNNSFIIGPFRSDGYQFVMSKSGYVHAGCRIFDNLSDARKHWIATRGNTPLGNETMIILDYMEKSYELRTIHEK